MEGPRIHSTDAAGPQASVWGAPPADPEATLAAWIAAEQALRARQAPPGVSGVSRLAAEAGRDFLESMRTRALPTPPIGDTLGFVLMEVDAGRVVFQGTPALAHYNPIGTVHGGWIATLLDSAVGCAIHSALPRGSGYTTLELKVNYLKAVTDRVPRLRAEGRVVTVSRRVAVAEGRLHDAAGRLYALATTTCLVFPLPAEGTGTVS
jgi:uncharacterized protein (TIGR00369 family)